MWWPSSEELERTNLSGLLRATGFADFSQLHRWSVDDPAAFWSRMIGELGICFRRPPRAVLDLTGGVQRPVWLQGAEWNIVESCFRADPQAPALVFGSGEGDHGPLSVQTYAELHREVRRIAMALRRHGFQPADRLAIVMPMIPEAVAIYLGVIYAGCAVVSIADSFAAEEIGRRLRIANARGVFCVDHFVRGGKRIELYERIRDAHPPQTIVLASDGSSSPVRPGDWLFQEFVNDDELAESHVADSDEIINVLFSSGTTGDPKAIPWTHVTPIKCAADGAFHHDIRQGDVVTWPTNLGWMMGPWLIFASLIQRATIGLFQDVTQSAAFGHFVERAQVTMLGVVPALVRAWRASRCMEGRNWSSVRCFSSTGESSQADDMRYLSALAGGKPVIEYCGGTEIGGGYITSTLMHPNVPSAFACPALGSQFVILDEAGHPADEGELFLIPPALGLSNRLLNRDHEATYFEDCPTGPQGQVLRRHGDHFRRLPGDYYVAGGRVDDTMNLGGIKVSSAELEQVLNGIPEISETAAVSVPPPEGGPEELAVFAILRHSAECGPVRGPDLAALRDRMNQELKTHLNPLFRVTHLRVLSHFPRTASNKVMRRELRTLLAPKP
ncbi:MAG TPA: AMP-binding protein, partial [Pirellulaceae bacterium]